MRQARKIVRETVGPATTLAVCQSQTPEEARQRGFEMNVWVREGLVDAIIASNYYFDSVPDLPLAAWRSWIGPNVKLYAGSDAFLIENGKSRIEKGSVPNTANIPISPHPVLRAASAPVDAFVSNASDKEGNPPFDAIETIASTS